MAKRKATTASKRKVKRKGVARGKRTRSASRPKRVTKQIRAARVPLSSQMRNELAVMHDPFSKATTQPRIPDGKATHSLGERHQAVFEIAPDPIGSGIISLVVYPGLGAGLAVYGASAIPVIPTGGPAVVGYGDFGDAQFSSLGALATDADLSLENLDRIGRWRLVSQALNLKLLNPAEEDDGWWEAIRIKTPMLESDYCVAPKNNDWSNGYNGNNLCLAPRNVPGLFAQSTSLADEPGYTTGLLRDLHKVNFDLRPTADEVEFNDYAEVHNLPSLADTDPDNCWGTSPAVHNALTPTDWFGFRDGNTHANRCIRGHIDFGHDMVYLRLHCRTEAGPSRFLAHLVSNSEVIYGNTEKESRYMNPSNTHPNIARNMDARRSNPEPMQTTSAI